jgi:hypothetical protein
MATKMKLVRMLQEVKGLAQITNRKPAPRPPFLYLVQLRAQTTQCETPRRRLRVEVEAARPPLPVKINHISTNEPEMPVVIA